MKRYLIILSVLTLTLLANEKKYPLGFEHSNPPPGDEFLTNRFGHTWSDPTYNGYLLVDDHYVDAPYVIEQRGFVVFVNGERVEDGVDIRLVLPLPPPPAVTNDPGPPPGITRETRGSAAVSHPVYIDRLRYLDYLNLPEAERFKIEYEYLRQLPCISNIVPKTVEGGPSNGFMVYDYSGGRFGTRLPSFPKISSIPRYEDDRLYALLKMEYNSIGGLLYGDNFVHIRNGGLVGNESASLTTNMWRECLEIMSENITPEERYAKIKAKGHFPVEDFNALRGFYPFDGFKPTTQLWQRLSGDMSWTNDGPARMFALTNGWQKIIPAFMRTQTVVVATIVATPSDKTEGVDAQQPKKHGKPVHKGSSPATPTPESDDIPMSSNSITWWFIGCTALVVIGLAVLWRHNSRKS